MNEIEAVLKRAAPASPSAEHEPRMKRITSNYVITTELVEETGVPAVDDALYSLVNALSLGVGESLRAVFLLGSYADGSNAPDSDFDVCLLRGDRGAGASAGGFVCRAPESDTSAAGRPNVHRVGGALL